MSGRRVVVTGAGVVCPIGVGRRALHDALVAGRSGIGPITRFDASLYPTSIAAEVRGFDLSSVVELPVELRVAASDRKAAFVIGASALAVEEAFGGFDRIPYEPSDRALSMGVGVEVFRMEEISPWFDEGGDVDGAGLFDHLAARSFCDSFRIPSDLGPLVLSRLASIGGFRRVNVGACVASAQAIGEAYRAIQRGRARMVIAGGADSMINPLGVAGFGLLAATSTSNHLGSAASRPFDKHRDGFVLGEGGAAVVLEEQEAAVARGAPVLAEVIGYGTSMDAFKITDPAEDGAGAIEAMRRALADAHLDPADVGYVNAHGTSTVKNDAVETMAIKAVFGPSARTVPISSTKSMIGHCIAGAGAIEFVASLLCFERQVVPPTLNLRTPDPACDLDYVPGAARRADVGTFLSNSFGFGGQNATLVATRPRPR